MKTIFKSHKPVEFQTAIGKSEYGTPLRQAVAKAEAISGRKVNVNAVGAGVHSHDGGRSWHGGHG